MTNFTRAQMPDPNAADRAVRRVAEAAHRLNEAIHKAVEQGHCVELERTSRIHDGQGAWGDQMAPMVRERAQG